jgi:predicted nucleic acid-binding protein
LKQTPAINLVIADTSPLIAIAVMGLFPELNKLFSQVIVPEAVVQECMLDLSKPQSVIIKKALTDNVIQQQKVTYTEACQLLGQILDPGEAEAICLAKQLGAIALIDEKAGRKIAAREGVKCIGSLYVLIKVKQNGSIASVVPLIMRLQEHGYYLDSRLIETVFLACNELNDKNMNILEVKI